MAAVKSNVIRLYDVRPEMALEHLKRSTGLDFSDMPESLAAMIEPVKDPVVEESVPVLTDVVQFPVYQKA